MFLSGRGEYAEPLVCQPVMLRVSGGTQEHSFLLTSCFVSPVRSSDGTVLLTSSSGVPLCDLRTSSESEKELLFNSKLSGKHQNLNTEQKFNILKLLL